MLFFLNVFSDYFLQRLEMFSVLPVSRRRKWDALKRRDVRGVSKKQTMWRSKLKASLHISSRFVSAQLKFVST